jgi:hypothetical protein
MQATIPLVVLTLSANRLSLQVRPWFLAKITGIQMLEVEASDDAVIYPVSSRLGTRGIEIRMLHRQSYYFWPRKDYTELLPTLSASGFAVSGEAGQLP